MTVANNVRPLIDHFNDALQNVIKNSPNQSIDERRIKFKKNLSMEHYIKIKTVKQGFKFWFRCDSRTWYFYELNMYLGRIKYIQNNLGESVVLNLAMSLNGSYYILLFDNFFLLPISF